MKSSALRWACHMLLVPVPCAGRIWTLLWRIQPGKRITDNIFSGLYLLRKPKRLFSVTIAVRPAGSIFGGLLQYTICELDQQV